MAVAKVEFRRARAHTRYRLADNTIVPGVTTITGLIDKSHALVPWSNDLGLRGYDVKAYTDPLKGVGTLGHARIIADLTGASLSEDLDEYSKKEIDLSDNCLLSWWKFKEEHRFGKIYDCEKPRVSERYKFGGTIDIPAVIDDYLTILDLKTGSGIYEDYLVQVAAYCHLFEEVEGEKSERIILLNVPRTPDEEYDPATFGQKAIDVGWRYFLNKLEEHHLKKELTPVFKRRGGF
jgi:hypothetical protein